jgi:hypothetical protein
VLEGEKMRESDWPPGAYLCSEIHPYTAERLHEPDEQGRARVFLKLDGHDSSFEIPWDDNVLQPVPELAAHMRAIIARYGL